MKPTAIPITPRVVPAADPKTDDGRPKVLRLDGRQSDAVV